MSDPRWHNVALTPVPSYHEIIAYFSAPKPKKVLNSLGRGRPGDCWRSTTSSASPWPSSSGSTGVAVDAVFDTVSVATTFKGEARPELGNYLLLVLRRRSREHPGAGARVSGLGGPVLGQLLRHAELGGLLPTARSAISPRASAARWNLSTYFRINAANTGQFERTLIIADEGGVRVSYWRAARRRCAMRTSCTPPWSNWWRMKDATIKYSTVQNWYPGDKDGNGGIYNFVTKRGMCQGATAKITWTQVETGSAMTWKYPSCILQGDNSVGEFYSVALTNNKQQADTGTKMVHIGKNTRSTIVSKGISAGRGQNTYRGLVRSTPARRTPATTRSATRCFSATAAARTPSRTSTSRTRPRLSSTRRPRRRSARTRYSTATSAASPPRTPSP